MTEEYYKMIDFIRAPLYYKNVMSIFYKAFVHNDTIPKLPWRPLPNILFLFRQILINRSRFILFSDFEYQRIHSGWRVVVCDYQHQVLGGWPRYDEENRWGRR